MSFSNYLELELLDHLFGKGAYSTPTVYVSLHTGDPGETGANECANANNYARKTTAAGDWNVASAGTTDNANELAFNQASGSWGTVTHFGLWDSGTYGAGNFLGGGSLSASKAIDNGDTPRFAAGALDVTLD